MKKSHDAKGKIMARKFLHRESLLIQFSPKRIEYFKIWGPLIFLVTVIFFVASFFVQPAPPGKITIAAGDKSGAYFDFATQYAPIFDNVGIELVIRETKGTAENYELLLNDSHDVDAAIVQGGVAKDPTANSSIESIASLYYEPVWLFYRDSEPLTKLQQLQGKKIAIGAIGSGTRPVAEALLRESGVFTESSLSNGNPEVDKKSFDARSGSLNSTQFFSIGDQEAAASLLAKKVDAAFFIISPLSETVLQLIESPDIQLAELDASLAYSRRNRYLSNVILPKGILDIANDIPQSSSTLLAATANLVVRKDIHHSLIHLFANAVKKVHSNGGLLSDPGVFPNTDFVEFPMNANARHYFENGTSFLYRILPFWAASFADRTKILILPLLTLILPMFRIAPPLYRWRIRRRIYLWYRVLKKVDEDLHQAESGNNVNLESNISNLARLSSEVDEATVVPLSYMQEFYQLRMHIEMTRYRFNELVQLLGSSKAISDSTDKSE